MRRILAVALLAAAMPRQAGAQGAPPEAASPQCRSPEHRQFDFWLGEWDAYDLPDTTRVVASTRVTRILGGCALREVHVQGDGLHGESFSLWDAARGRWHQSWVTNRGGLLLLEGRLEGERMVLTAPEWKPDGSSTLLRGTWWREGADVRQLAERSSDGGRTWVRVWEILFRPRRASSSR